MLPVALRAACAGRKHPPPSTPSRPRPLGLHHEEGDLRQRPLRKRDQVHRRSRPHPERCEPQDVEGQGRQVRPEAGQTPVESCQLVRNLWSERKNFRRQCPAHPWPCLLQAGQLFIVLLLNIVRDFLGRRALILLDLEL